MRSKQEQEYWYQVGYTNGYYDMDDRDLNIPPEYLVDYGYGLLDGDINAHPEDY